MSLVRAHRAWFVLLPHIAGACWLLLVGAAVWGHAARSAQPPIYDAFTYAQKARSVSTVLGEGRLLDVLNTEPTNRPPGSVVMSYPLGFDATFHAFYFRSVFIPVVLAYLAVTIAGLQKASSKRSQWALLSLALGASSMPILFQFEYNDALPTPGYWGLVDNFMAGVSGLAAAATVQSLSRSSLGWLTVALLASGFALFIKPAGLLSMALVTSCFAILATLKVTAPRLAHSERRRLRPFLVRGLLLTVVLHGLAVVTAFSSPYLSAANVSFYEGAVALLRRHMSSPVTAGLLHTTLHTSIGYPMLAALLLAMALWAVRGPRLADDGLPRLWLGLATLAVVAFGLAFLWILGTGLPQVRYAMPSVLMGLVFLTPFLLRASQGAPTWGKTVLSLLWSLPPLGLGCLLFLSAPPVIGQRLLGVNLTSDGAVEQVEQARSLIEKLRRLDRPAVVYSFYSGSATATFECVSFWQRLIEPAGRSFTTRLPLDWRRPPSFRLDEIVAADYVVFTPVRDPAARARAVAPRAVATFAQESALFHAVFTDLGEEAGVRVVWDSNATRLLRVRRGDTLRRVVASSLRGYRFRAEFLAANRDLAPGPP